MIYLISWVFLAWNFFKFFGPPRDFWIKFSFNYFFYLSYRDETLNDYKSDEDPDFEPVEAQENSSDEEESELSSIDEDDEEEAGDDASAGEPEAGDENMVE